MDVDRLCQINSSKDNARAWRCRPERQFNTLAAVQTHTHGLGEGFDGSLSKHGRILNSQTEACLKRVLRPTF
jgi:hypothetical protein